MQIDIDDIGNTVVCDLCNEDFTHREDCGGLLFGSKACCPDCAAGIEKDAKIYGELSHIKDRCPKDMSFRDWVLSLRNGDNTVKTISFESVDEMIEYLRKETGQ